MRDAPDIVRTAGSVNLRISLDGKMVWFTPRGGTVPIRARVTAVHPTLGDPPCVDLSADSGAVFAVPHRYHMQPDEGRFWSMTEDGDEVPVVRP